MSLDTWLKEHALTCQEMHTARTFVWQDEGSDRVWAYYSLVMHTVEPDVLPRSIRGSATGPIPSVLIAKLARDETVRGQELGGELLLNALRRAVEAVSLCAARAVVVDAISEHAAAFYESHDFRRLESDPLRLWLKMSSLIKTIGGW